MWPGAAAARDPRRGQRSLRGSGGAGRRGADHSGEGAGRPRGSLPASPHAGVPVPGDGGGSTPGARGARRRPRRGAPMMRLPPFRYIAARTAREAATILAAHGLEAMAVAGGTDLLPNMKRRQFEPKGLVGLRGIAEGDGIAANGGLRLGALATLTEVAEHPAVPARWPRLAPSAGLLASPPLPNARHLGGIPSVVTRSPACT